MSMSEKGKAAFTIEVSKEGLVPLPVRNFDLRSGTLRRQIDQIRTGDRIVLSLVLFNDITLGTELA